MNDISEINQIVKEATKFEEIIVAVMKPIIRSEFAKTADEKLALKEAKKSYKLQKQKQHE